MKGIRIVFLMLVLGSTAASFFYFKSRKPKCKGKDRWDVKTLTDSNESKVNFNPFKTTIAALISIPPQTAPRSTTPRFGIEFNTYTIRCRIREYKQSSDGDYHLVLSDIDDPSKTLIGEIPHPGCKTTKKSKHLNQFIKARQDFEKSSSFFFHRDSRIYTITGVAYYDRVHGQLGVSPTGVEIHPILSISTDQ